MGKPKFLLLLLTTIITLLFLKIFQHNRYIWQNYEKQKLTKRYAFLKKQKNKYLIRLAHLQNPSRLKKIAMEQLEMRPLKFNNLKTIITSSSSQQIPTDQTR